MNLTELESVLEEKGYEANYVEINNKTVKQNRVYLDLEDKRNRKFNCYFIQVKNKLFLHIFVNRPKDFDGGYKHTEEEKQRCKEAKFKALKLLKDDGITGIEEYDSAEFVLLSPSEGNKKRMEL